MLVMVERYLMLDLDDDKISSLADVISNKTCKKIINYLAEREANETEIARDLKLPANTVNYNVKKLLEAGLIEKSKNFFWSVKGRKIPMYKIANKKIVISPRSKGVIKSVIGSILIVGAGSLVLRTYQGNFYSADNVKVSSADYASEGALVGGDAAVRAGESVVNSVGVMPEVWLWFLLGGSVALIVFMVLNWRRM